MSGPLHFIDYSVVAAYLLAMVAMGWVMASRISAFKDYFLAGGMLTTPLLVCTLVSSYYELDVTFATSESAYHYGLVAWVWLSRPYYVCIILAALLVAPRIRRISAESGGMFMTLPDLLEHHYGRRTRIVGAIACFIYSLPITAMGGMVVMFQVLGWPSDVGLILAIGVCAIYTMVGGLWADAITDTVQFTLMCVALAVAIPPALKAVGGFEFVHHLPPRHMTATGGLSPWLMVAWSAGALTVFVEPAFYQRIFAARDSRTVMRSLLIGIVLWASYDWGVTLLGMIARAALPDVEGKAALMAICMQTLPIGLRGLFIGGVLAAAMSSVDSYGLLASGNLVYDIYRPLARRPLSEKMLIRLTRVGVLAVMLLAAGMSLAFEKLTHAWVFMSSVMASVVFVPVMGAVVGRPRRAAGLWASAAGLLALALYYGLIYLNGAEDPDAESYVWRIGHLELWREYAVIFALPISAAGFVCGHWLGGSRETH